MTRHILRENLMAYLEDELSAAERREAEQHLSSCPGCADDLAELTALRGRLRSSLQAAAAAVEAPADAWARLQASLGAERQAPLKPAPVRRLRLPRFSTNHDEGNMPTMKRYAAVSVFSIVLLILLAGAFVAVIVLPSTGDAGQQPTPEATTTLLPDSVVIEVTPLGQFLTPTYEAPEEEGIPASLPLLVPMRRIADLTHTLTEPRFDGGQSVLYWNNDAYLAVMQSAGAMGDLPEGEAITVSGLPGVIVREHFDEPLTLEVTAMDGSSTVITYQDTTQIVWALPFGVTVSLGSNLPEEQLLDFANALAVTFTPLASGSSPSDFHATRGAVGVFAGTMLTEDCYYGSERFVIVRQQLNLIGEGLGGEALTVRGRDAVLYRGESGTANLANDDYLGGIEGITIVGTNFGFDGRAQLHPEPLDYTDGFRLVWIERGVRIELLSNLPEDELIAFAEAMAQGLSPSQSIRADARWENGLFLPWLYLPIAPVNPGDGIMVVLTWEVESQLEADLTMFVHLVDSAGNVVAQMEAPPGQDATSTWLPGQENEMWVSVPTGADLAPGFYWLRIGWYDPLTGERVLLEGEKGSYAPDFTIVVKPGPNPYP